MRVAILESIITSAGHEVEFDGILADELKRQGHEPVFFVPEHYPFKIDYRTDIEYLDGGEAITYAGAGRLKKLYLGMQRERRRRAWFTCACEKAKAGRCDAIIVPTATYRYLKALRDSELKNSPVPVYFIFHGINPREKAKFEKQARLTEGFSQIHLKVITLRNDFKHSRLNNVDLIPPPVYKPRNLPVNKNLNFTPPIKLGFFGQFRKEKKLQFFLDSFVKAKFSVPVQLLVQGATDDPENGRLFEKIARQYAEYTNITFLHKNLIGEEWQKALLEADAIMIPYASERYRYHWSAMLFTAIGFYKPFLSSPELNPEVLEKYKIGMAADLSSAEAFSCQLEKFVADLAEHGNEYARSLAAANEAFGHKKLIRNILS